MHMHLLQECVENGAFLSHVLLLQCSSDVLQGDVRAVGPQVRVKTSLSYLHSLIHQVQQLVMLWGRWEKFGKGVTLLLSSGC